MPFLQTVIVSDLCLKVGGRVKGANLFSIDQYMGAGLAPSNTIPHSTFKRM